MPDAVETQSTTAPTKTRRRSRSFSDKRRGRSRSPGAYLRKKGKSLKGFFKVRSSRRLEGAKKSRASKSAPPKATPTTTGPPAAVTTTTAKEEEAAVYDIKIDEVDSEVLKNSSSNTVSEANESETKDTTSTASKTSETDPQDQTQTTGLKTEEEISNTVQIVLLLIDPTSRRFELIQLEFDSVKAIVQDLLSQIPSSATEESLRDQGYEGICTIGGEEMNCTGKLKDFVKQNEGINAVVLAMPEGMSPEDCAKMAKPILADKNVAAVVDPSGNMQSLGFRGGITEDPDEQESKATTDVAEESVTAVTESKESTKEVIEGTPTEEQAVLPKKKPSLFGIVHSLDGDVFPMPLLVLAMSMFFVPALAFVLYRRHSIISAPFSTGDIIKPGVTRSYWSV